MTGDTPDDEDVTIPTFMYHGMHVRDLRQAKEAGIYDEATPDFRERGPRGRAWFPARGGMEPTPGYDDIAAHADAAADATDLRQARRADD